MEPAVDPEAVADESRRADALRRTVDVACALLRQARLTREEAESVVAFTRARVIELFPGKEDVWGLVLAPRFARIVDEFSVQENERARRVP
jgi:LPS sulfotransferase NodH